MANYFRITAYHPEKDFSVILDSNGKFEKLWQFSAYLVQRGFKIAEAGNVDNIIDSTFPLASQTSNKILLRAIGKGRPETQELVYQGKPSKAITVYDKIYGQYVLQSCR